MAAINVNDMKRAATRPPEVEEDEEWDDEESERQRLIAEETIADAGGDYQFKCTLHRHYEYESAMLVAVSITHGSTEVGSVKAFLIDRDFRPRWQFHELCDSESQELQEMGVLFCNDDGTVRYADIDGLDAGTDGAASRGGFLQIELVTLVEAHRHKDVGVRCVKALLEWMNARDERERRERKERRAAQRPDLSRPPDAAALDWLTGGRECKNLHSSWTLAALMPGLETTAEDTLRMRNPAAHNAEPSAEELAREEKAAAQAVIARRKVALQWARLGFRQAKFASDYWYLTPSRLCLKTKADVAELQITKMPEVEPVAEADVPLSEYFFRCKREGRPATFEQDIRRLVAQGADLNRVHALHRALCNDVSAEADFRLLVSLGADPKTLNEMGQTALHFTSTLVGGDEQKKARAVVAAKALVAVGVPLSVVDVHGDTAERQCRLVLKQLRHHADFEGAFNLGRRDAMHAQRP